ncbi:MAG: protein arginine kinase [Clostridia bacterium]|nr:MAG: protein arginine kinase [Clostridia bacterium]
MDGSGPYADLIISSRIRLARNLAGWPFPSLLSPERRQEVAREINKAAHAEAAYAVAGELEMVMLDALSPVQRQILVEKHLISPQHAENEAEGAVILREDETISIMVNEEDHLRLQSFCPGLQLAECWRLANALDDALEQTLEFAFDERKGYLTACPTNVGTGLRASVMAHLPGLVHTRQARRILSALSQVGLAVRGIYGEGSEPVGNLFQISNQITLGRSEEDIIDNLAVVTRQIVDQETSAREVLQRETGPQLQDRVGRAYGLLTNAAVIGSEEALALLSDLRLGVDLALVKGIERRTINELMVAIQPAYLQEKAGRKMSPMERDVLRASVIRQRLQNKSGGVL